MGRKSKKNRKGGGPAVQTKLFISNWHLNSRKFRDNLWHPTRKESAPSQITYEATFMDMLNLRKQRA